MKSGHYAGLELALGTYRVETSKQDFRTCTVDGLVLSAGRTLRADISLIVGAAHETVFVSAEAGQIDTVAGAWGGSIGKRQLDALPLNGRDVFDLVSQQPGATAPASATKTISSGLGVHISINGSRPSENGFRLDGIYINDITGSAPASASGNLLGLETIEELRLIASPFSAEYGRSSGGVVTAVSKSGGNQFHGSLYEYLRNSALDAKNFFDAGAQPIPAFRRNQFGGLIGGPLRRNKLFFIANYEGVRLASSSTQSAPTLTAQARQGILPINGVPAKVTVAPAMVPFIALFPLPNGQDYGDGSAAYTAGVPSRVNENYGSAKLDYVANDRLRFNARYTEDSGGGSTADLFRVWNYGSDSSYRLFQAGGEYTQSSTLIHEFHAGLSQIRNGQENTVPSQISAGATYIPGSQLGPLAVTGLGLIGTTDARTSPRRFALTDTQLSYSLTKSLGVHKLSFGSSFDRIFLYQISNLDATGYYVFGSIQSFLAGQSQSASVMLPGSNSDRHWRMNQFSLFAQDDFRLTRRISAAIGVRYETASVPVERDGRVASLRDPAHDAQVTRGGPLYENPSKLNFNPRASLAWDMAGNGRTVLRLGSGMFSELLGARELTVAGTRMPPFFRRATITRAAFPDVLAAATGASAASSVDGITYYPSQPYTVQFQAVLEHQIGSSAVAQAGYAGSRGIHLAGDVTNLNTTQPQFLANGQVFFPATNPLVNPAFGQIGMRVTNFDSNYQSLNLGVRATPARGLIVQTKFTWSKSIDDLSIAIFADSVTGNHVPTIFNYRANRGPSDFDQRLTYASNFVYDVPGTGFRNADFVLAGWSIQGLIQVQSGNPFNPTVGFDDARLRGATNDQGQRPDYVSGQPLVFGDPQQYFNPLAFSLPAAGFYGNLGRNTITGPGLVFASAAVARTFWKTERQAIHVRMEMFNLANHPNFQIPSNNLALFASTGARVGSAGQITSTATSSRQIQLSARYTF